MRVRLRYVQLNVIPTLVIRPFVVCCVVRPRFCTFMFSAGARSS